MRAGSPHPIVSERDVRAIGLSLAETIALIEQVYLLDAQGGVEVPMKIGVHPLEPDTSCTPCRPGSKARVRSA